uniref:Uncharacterized protein n=1 Tax=Tanacetum cinerariifolium TaxID=118510 RepID=A0A6L2JTC1_TANCI|nr:hypothetical protein [Tanacetum cinerariifolium]
MAQAVGTQSSFNEFLATPNEFSAFIMHWLKIDNLTQEVLTNPTYDLIKGMCKSVVELEYYLEEVFKATNDQLEWHNPEGKPYPHDLSKPLSLILNERDGLSFKHVWKIYNWESKATRRRSTSQVQTYPLDLKRMTPYTTYLDIQGIIYEDEKNRNYLMRTDERHKFSDGTLYHVRTAVNDIATGIEMDYLPKRKWSKQDK